MSRIQVREPMRRRAKGNENIDYVAVGRIIESVQPLIEESFGSLTRQFPKVVVTRFDPSSTSSIYPKMFLGLRHEPKDNNRKTNQHQIVGSTPAACLLEPKEEEAIMCGEFMAEFGRRFPQIQIEPLSVVQGIFGYKLKLKSPPQKSA